MIVAWDEEFASVKLYHDIKDVGVKPYEVIPIEDLLDAWEKQKAEQTEPNSSEKPNNCEELNAYRECVKSRSFWDNKHCDGCYFDERCPFDEPKDEPQKKEVEWVYNKRERLWYPYSNGKPLFKDEPQKWTKENCKGCKYNEYPYDESTCFVRVCINGNKYEPKE